MISSSHHSWDVCFFNWSCITFWKDFNLTEKNSIRNACIHLSQGFKLNTYVLPHSSLQNSCVEIPTASVMLLGSRTSEWGSDHKKGGFINGISAFTRDSREFGHHLHYVRTEQQVSCTQTRKQTLPRGWICWHLDLGLPSLGNIRNKCLLFTSHQSKVLHYSGWNT